MMVLWYFISHFHRTSCCLVTKVYCLLFFIVYDVTRRETFTNLSNIWAKEVDLYSTNEECIKILVGNKVDRVSCMRCQFPTHHSRQMKYLNYHLMNFLMHVCHSMSSTCCLYINVSYLILEFLSVWKSQTFHN